MLFKNILVGFDGSEHSLKAVKLAGNMAREMAASLWIVVAYDPLPSFLGEPNLQDAIMGRLKEAENLYEKALAEVGQVPGGIQCEILQGPPAEAILSVEKSRQIDLIIMGTRGLGSLAGLLIGSQSQKVIAQAECPVLLIR